MYKGRKIGVVVPAFNEEEHLAGVVRTLPDFVDRVIVVDDGSSDRTFEVAGQLTDARVEVVRHGANQGVGAAVVSGHRRSLELGMDISAVLAGDGQMDPRYLPKLLDAIIEGGYDFAKGNRFRSRGTIREMPRKRVWGNAILTFLTKFATGYWGIFDPQNGYTAITRAALEAIPLDRLRTDYLFENSILWELGLADLRVSDVSIPAVYRGQKSGIRTGHFSGLASLYLLARFWGRIFRKYMLRDFHPVAIFYTFGAILTLWGIAFGILVIYWSWGPPTASIATVMLSVVPFFLGVQMVLTAIMIDISLAPK